MTESQKERRREYAREYMRSKRLDPIYYEAELQKNRERFKRRDKQEYNIKRKIYRENNLERFQTYEREYARAQDRRNFVVVTLHSRCYYFCKTTNRIHYGKSVNSAYVLICNLSLTEKADLKEALFANG